MKNKVLIQFLIFCFSLPAAANSPIEFSARIKNENLAEEAIDLLHCLSQNLGLSWELTENGSGPYRLRLEEKEGKLSGTYVAPEGEEAVAFGPGEAGKACAELTEMPPIKPRALAEQTPLLSIEEIKPSPQKWLWVGAAAAAVVGGFFFWKSRQPDHRSLKMD